MSFPASSRGETARHGLTAAPLLEVAGGGSVPAPAARPSAERTRRTSARARARSLSVAALCLLAILALGPASASAAETHVFSSTLGAGVLSAPAGVAVNETTGDVYVADTGNDRVDEFESDGDFLRAWGWGVGDGLSPELQECTITCFKGLSGSGPGQFEAPTFIAVDNDASSVSFGDVYVGDAGDHLVTKFTAAGALVKTWGDSSLNGPAPQGQLDGSSATGGPFGALAGVAVDSFGNLDVFRQEEPDLLFRFAQDGSFATVFGALRETDPRGLAIDGASELFKVNGNGTVEQFTEASDIGQVSSGEAAGLAATGSELYVAQAGQVLHYAFKDPGGEPGVVLQAGGSTCKVAPEEPCPATDTFGAEQLTGADGIAADGSTGSVFVADAAAGDVVVFDRAIVPEPTTGAASEIKPAAHTAVLNGSVNPGGVQLTECVFEYGPTTGYGTSVPCVPEAAVIPADSSEHAVKAEITGLTPGITYHFRLRAENANGVPRFGADATFPTFPLPAITGAVATNLTAETADLEAQIGPGGLETTYQFEYGKSTTYATIIPGSETLAAQSTPLAVHTHLEGLEQGATYHWRLIATSEAGTTTGVDHTFVYSLPAGGLPDGRAYEMVTPPHKNGALVGDIPFGGPPPEISEDGSRLISGTVQCFDGAVSCPPIRGSTVGTPYLFKRTLAGWSAIPLAPSASELEINSWWPGDSAEGETALFSGPTPPHGEDDFYARNAEGHFSDIGPLSPPSGGPSLLDAQGIARLAASTNLSHVIFLADEPVWPGSFSEPGGGSLYEYVGTGNSKPAFVGVSGGLGSEDLISACGIELGKQAPGVEGDISADGRVVYFTSIGHCDGTVANATTPLPVNELFARVDGGEGGAHTVAISEPQARQVPAEPQANCTGECLANTSDTNEGAWREADFKGTSTDGSKAFFTSAQQLTNGAVQESTNLYLYDADSAGHHWFDVSEGEGGKVVVGGPRVRGVLAYSSDGSHVYFVAQGELTGANAEGHSPVGGKYNLYAYQRDSAFPAGHLAFIAVLNSEDINNELGANHPGEPANVTPDGRFLVFTSGANLAPDATRTDGASQVYRYDALTGRLQRLSIGERGFNDDGNGGAGNAMIVPGYKGYVSGAPVRPDPTMANDGSRVFFMSPVALTPGAVPSLRVGTSEGGETLYAENVYEWESEDVGSCPPGRGEGCVFLISDGHDTSTSPPEECSPSDSAVCLFGTDASGSNVFFTTVDPLVSSATGPQLALYDARICEPAAGNPCISAPASVSPCSGEECRGAPAPAPAPAAAPTASFNGEGNLIPKASSPAAKPKAKPLTRAQKLAAALKVCRRKPKNKRAACERQARRKYGPLKKATKSSNNKPRSK